jgi:PAS domain S-box-containing protein
MHTNMIGIIIVVTAVILVLIISLLVNVLLASRRLRKEHEFTSKVLDTTSAFILVLNSEGRVLDCNKRYHMLTGLKPGDVFKSSAETPPLVNGKDDFSESRVLNQFEERLTGRDGQVRTILWSKGSIKDIHGEVQWILTGIDVTKQKEAYEKLRLHRTQLRALSSELSLSEERERRRIAGELHDRIGSYLAMVKLKIGELQQDLSSSELAKVVDQLDQLISQTIQDTRTLIFEISPPILQELGFVAAIKWLAEKTSKEHEIKVSVVNSPKNPLVVGEKMRVILYRAVRELLINVVKHSRASAANISIITDNSHLCVNIEDNGIGFNNLTTDNDNDMRNYSGGFGLFNIKENIVHHKGYFTIESQKSGGTLARIKVPLQEIIDKQNLLKK